MEHTVAPDDHLESDAASAWRAPMLAGPLYSIISPVTWKQKARPNWRRAIPDDLPAWARESNRPRTVTDHIPYSLLTLPQSTLDGPTGFQKNVADGYFIYHDASGYHMRLTSTKVVDVVDYKSTILTDGGRFSLVALYHREKGDYYKLYGGADCCVAFHLCYNRAVTQV
jgi:hypothetical protein